MSEAMVVVVVVVFVVALSFGEDVVSLAMIGTVAGFLCHLAPTVAARVTGVLLPQSLCSVTRLFSSSLADVDEEDDVSSTSAPVFVTVPAGPHCAGPLPEASRRRRVAYRG